MIPRFLKREGGRIAVPFLTCFGAAMACGQLPTRVVDTSIDPYAMPCAAYSRTGALLVGYADNSEGSIKLAEFLDDQLAVAPLFDSIGGVLHAVSLIEDSIGCRQVAYFDGPGVFYGLSCDGVFDPLNGQIANASSGASPVMVLDSNDRPFIAAFDEGELMVWQFDIQSGQWFGEPLPGPTPLYSGTANERFFAIAVNSRDQPVVAYLTDYEEGVALLTRVSDGWTTRTHPVQIQSNSSPLSLAIDGNDTAYVACSTYRDTPELTVLRFGILGVTEQTAVSDVAPILGPQAMRIDGSGRMRIAYVDQDHALYLARNDLGWSSALVREDVGVFAWPSVAISAEDRWAVAFFDGNDGSVRIAGVEIASPLLAGDLNCDGVVNNFDIDPFVLALTDPAQYALLYPTCDIGLGDINGDGLVNNFDIDPFVALLVGS